MGMSTPVGRFTFFLKRLYLKNVDVSHVIVIVLAVAVVFWPVYHFKFLLGWDDQWFVTNHYTENGFVWRNLKAIFTEFYYGQYAPVNQLYYTTLYALLKYHPAYYHVAGVGVHAINAILVYYLIQTLSQKLSNISAIHAKQISFFTALLFAVLPVNVEPVAWVAASKILLYALFYLLALHTYCRYLQDNQSLFFYATLYLFVISFGAKEQAVLLPVCLLLFDFLYGRNFKNKIIWLEKLPFFILALFFCLVTIQSQEIAEEESLFYPLYQRIPLACFTLTEYFTKSLTPVNLSYLYPYPFQAGETVPWWLWIYVVAIPTIIFCFYKQIKAKWLLFGLLFFFIHVILVINVFPLARHSVIADRYTYVATVGLCFMLSYFFVLTLNRKKFRVPVLIAGIFYVGALMAYTRSHINVWTNAYALKEKLKNTIEQRPDFNELKKLK